MPFGAELVEGGVRFRLWAPAAKSVVLRLFEKAGPHALPLNPRPGGWFELVTDAARAGSRYKFRIDGGVEVPDPAARANEDIEGASIVIDPGSYDWGDADWRGRPWHEASIYELHVGTFTPEGTFAGVESRLDHLVNLGVTVIELMPIGDFPGARGWGYDGVLPFAPDAAYGTPDELKSLIDAAHRRGLAMMLDVVYNHFGPEGNWLHLYAPQFFTDRHHTPWGAAINFDGPDSRTVRDFFIHNALYWLEEYRFDGLRVDAVHAMHDDGERHFIQEMTERLHEGPGRTRSGLDPQAHASGEGAQARAGSVPGAPADAEAPAQGSDDKRPIYVVLENGANQAHLLGTPGAPCEAAHADAQWNDDVHHCLHVILTGETDGYYVDYARRPHEMLARALAEGFGYQGEASEHAGGRARGEPSGHLAPTAFVNFLQNHDQIGNRAFGERLHQLTKEEARLVAATAVLLLSPSPPMLFMGEEWAAPEPFIYFCDFGPELAAKVREGRRQEFAKFTHFSGQDAANLPDPTAPGTFERVKLDWQKVDMPSHAGWLEHYRRLLTIRQRDIVPRIPEIRSARCVKVDASGAFAVDWTTADGGTLHLLANLTHSPAPMVGRAAGRVIYSTHPNIRGTMKRNELEPWNVTWLWESARG